MWRRRISSALKPASEFCSTSQRETLGRAAKPHQLMKQPSHTRNFLSQASGTSEIVISGSEISYLCKLSQNIRPVALLGIRGLYQLSGHSASSPLSPCMYRSFASASGSEKPGKDQNKTKKEVSTVEDPFDSPTYHIPEKPVTFTEGASYSLVILVGLGLAGAAAYAVFKELIFQPKEYKIFDKALERVQNDGQVKARIGSPIKGYGQETRNRAARQQIPNRVWKDEDGVEHVEVLFQIRGPHGGGQVRCEMFKDNVDNQWKFTYLTVDIHSPSRTHLILESFFSS